MHVSRPDPFSAVRSHQPACARRNAGGQRTDRGDDHQVSVPAMGHPTGTVGRLIAAKEELQNEQRPAAPGVF